MLRQRTLSLVRNAVAVVLTSFPVITLAENLKLLNNFYCCICLLPQVHITMAASILKALLLTLILPLVSTSQATTVTYDWNITWVRANPDGQHERPTIGINGQWPLPHLTATVGDHIVINVDNQLGNQSTSLHFHGLYMNGSTHMDGPVGVSQCAIPSGMTFKYDFTVCNHWSIMISGVELTISRSTNPVHIGIIHTIVANTPMASAGLLSFTIQIFLIIMTKRSSLRCLIGIIIKCQA